MTRPNKAWVTDITYIRTWQGWLFPLLLVLVLWPAAPKPEPAKQHAARARERGA